MISSETLDGFPTVLHRISKYILENNIKLTFTPIAIFPTAEALTDEMKKILKRLLIVQLEINMPLRKGRHLLQKILMEN